MPRADAFNMAGRHVFLTGGTGMVGRTLLDYFATVARGGNAPRVSVLTRDPAGFAARFPVQAGLEGLTLVAGSLATLSSLPPGTTDVIHGAADTHAAAGHAAWIEQIVGGTRTVLAASTDAGVERFLLLSSGAVYGPQPSSLARLGEDYHGAPDPLRPGSTYGQAKRLAEQLCTVFLNERGLHTVVARLFAFGGAHTPRDGRYALGNFVRDALSAAGDPIRVAGDGTAVRSYLGGYDTAHALVTAWCVGESGQAYNIGSEEPVTIAELARKVRDRLSPSREIAVLGGAGDGQRSRYVPDVSRIASFGAASRTDLDQVIDETAGIAR